MGKAYTEREKSRFVEQMWLEGLRPKTASAMWGGPSRALLSAWERQALAGELDASPPDVPGRVEGHVRHTAYPEATVAEALRLRRLGWAPRRIALRLNLPDSALVRAWERRRGAEGGNISPTAGAGPRGGRRKMDEETARELERLRMENAALRELMRDPKSGDPASLSTRRRAGLCERLRRETGYPLRRILDFLSLPKSTYEYHRARTARASGTPGGSGLDEAVARAFADSGGTYGYRRVRAAVLASGAVASCPERRVRESMARQGLVARSPRRARRWSSYAGEISEAPPNLLLGERGRHDFTAQAPDERWVTDITEMRAGGGRKVYLSVVVDLFDGRVAGWSASERPDAELANSSLLAAVARRREGASTLVHSDRGAHYRWPGWVAICEEAGLTRSMSRKGRSPDNAACEGFFGRMKVEMYHGRGWDGLAPERLIAEVGRYIEAYNGARLKSFRPPGGRTRTEYDTIDGRRRRLGYAV